MSVNEQIWFVIAIAGFLIFFEAAIITILKEGCNRLHGHFPRIGVWKDEYNDKAKIVAGLIIFVIALYKLFNLPST